MNDLLPILTYVLVSSFTPGPSNISSASLAVVHGYGKTLRYQAGLAAGVFLLMALSGWFSALILKLLPAVEPVLRFAGAGYILYLAWVILKASYTFEGDAPPPRFRNGVALQVLNPKLWVYAFSLFTGFLGRWAPNLLLTAGLAFILAGISFCATSTWAVFGTAIKTRLQNPRWRRAINSLLALSLVYAALALTGWI
jgi:cysteine/O-acetylserine efflux protein